MTVGPFVGAELAWAARGRGEDVILATQMATAEITHTAAETMASLVAATTWDWIAVSGAPTLMGPRRRHGSRDPG